MTTHLTPQQRWRTKNKDKIAEAQRRRRQANPTKYREMNKRSQRKSNLLISYGLTIEEYELLFDKQGRVCAICKLPKENKRNYHVDHDHKTGIVRGILCHHCNLMLGNARDNTTYLLAAVDYLNG